MGVSVKDSTVKHLIFVSYQASWTSNLINMNGCVVFALLGEEGTSFITDYYFDMINEINVN